jgi:hypothetical protein
LYAEDARLQSCTKNLSLCKNQLSEGGFVAAGAIAAMALKVAGTCRPTESAPREGSTEPTASESVSVDIKLSSISPSSQILAPRPVVKRRRGKHDGMYENIPSCEKGVRRTLLIAGSFVVPGTKEIVLKPRWVCLAAG